VLLSDGDLRKELASGRLKVEPLDEAMIQPSSIDVRLDRFFRVFNNTKYTHIDPRQQQDDLTSLVETVDDEPFVLIGQLCLFRLTSPAEHPYGSRQAGSRYQGQRGPTPSRAYLNFHRVDTRR
jgi:deoxycytidine triphosphate deaminase